jgi:hypothetical protein
MAVTSCKIRNDAMCSAGEDVRRRCKIDPLLHILILSVIERLEREKERREEVHSKKR